MKLGMMSATGVVTLTATLMLGAAGPSVAQGALPSELSAPQQSVSSLEFNGSTGVQEESQADKTARTKLNSLRGKQSATEIKAIVSSDKPANLLFDPAVGRYVAAYVTEESVSTQDITVSGPGCSTTSACLYQGSWSGYNGTGSLYGYWSNVTILKAGSYTTTFWYSSTNGTYVRPGATAYLPSPMTYNRITRS